jgi:DJ-1 family protein
MPRVLVPVAAGFEEIETSTIVDVLRRAGVEVVLAGLAGAGPVRGSRGIGFVAEVGLDEAIGPWDLVVLPGGMKNAEALAADKRVTGLLAERVEAGEPVAAICASALALDRAGVLTPGAYTCYPGVETRLATPGRRDEPVVDAVMVITSQGPGTAMAFALHLVARLVGESKRAEVAGALLTT